MHPNRFKKLFNIITNLLHILLWKVLYPKACRINFFQPLLAHLSIEVGKGKIIIGKRLYNRKPLHILVDNDGICKIGENCFFNHNCSITCLNKISIGDRCTFGNNLVLVDHDHAKDGGDFITGTVSIGNDTWVGANVVILRDTHIGRNCIIAAGSIVKGNVPDNTLYIQKRSSECKKIIQ